MGGGKNVYPNQKNRRFFYRRFFNFWRSSEHIENGLRCRPGFFDPHEQLSGGTLQLSHMVFDPLVRWTQDLQFEARLAESWERLGKLTFRFKLRSGVKFHSGNTLTATDVCWTYDRLNKSPDFKGLFEPFASCNVVDDLTVDLKTHKPYPLVLHQATYIFPMDSKFYSGNDNKGNPKDAITHGDSFASQNISGTRPFIITKPRTRRAR